MHLLATLALTFLHAFAADPDDAFLRKRADAMEALTRIEIEFARLRDKLYIERMTEVEKERVGVENGECRWRPPTFLCHS